MTSTPNGDAAASARAWGRGVTALCAAFVALGFAARVAPLFDQDGRLLQMFPTDDAYLMLTVSRNLALGRGMSVSEGTIAAHGVQPLATLLWAGCFWLVEGVKRSGVALVLAVEMLLGAAAALGVERLARIALADTRRPALAAALAASAWWASPVAVPHAMDALETQLCAASVIFATLLFLAPGTEKAWSLQRQLGFGCALGVCFLARSETLLFILGVCLVHPFRAIEARPGAVTRRLAETVVFGAVSLAVAAAWLMLDHFELGSVVAIADRAAELRAHLARNLTRVPTALVEFAVLVTPVPRPIRELPLVSIASALGCAGGLVAAAFAFRAASGRRRSLIALAVFFVVSLAALCAATVGARSPVERHLYPASPFLALAWSWAAIALAARLGAARLSWVAHALAAGVFALAAVSAVRAYRSGDANPQFRVVRWLEANVGADVWVAARPSGTVGFFHSRTLGLDPAANPEASEAERRGKLAEYVAAKRAPYIAGLKDASDFTREAPIRALYEVLVSDPEQNLEVLRLRRPRAEPESEPDSGQPDAPE